MNFESNHFPFSSDLDSIINFFARDKRLKNINILFSHNTFKFKSFMLLTTFILSLSILSNQNAFKSRSFISFIFIDIIREQIKIVFFKTHLNKRIFKRDFFHYNKVLNKVSRQFKRILKFLNKDYILIYLFNNIVISGNSTFESSLKLINNDDLFDIII